MNDTDTWNTDTRNTDTRNTDTRNTDTRNTDNYTVTNYGALHQDYVTICSTITSNTWKLQYIINHDSVFSFFGAHYTCYIYRFCNASMSASFTIKQNFVGCQYKQLAFFFKFSLNLNK